MGNKKCFVISPIGYENTSVREHADDLFDYIIKPAMDKCNIDAYRSDHVTTTGKITEEMISSLIEDDLCIAVLTYFNPNVFYELAVAQAANRPVILMLEKGNDIPFDIKDLRCLYYDFKPRDLMQGTYVDVLVENIKSIEQSQWGGDRIFGDFSPLGETPIIENHYKFYETSSDFGSPRSWIHQLENTNHVFEVMGIALGFWRKCSDILAAKAQEGCKIRIQLMDKNNSSLPHLLNGSLTSIDKDKIISELDDTFNFYQRLANLHENIEVRRMKSGTPHFQYTRTDSEILYTPYLYSKGTSFSPMWYCNKESPLYNILIEEFDTLWTLNNAD